MMNERMMMGAALMVTGLCVGAVANNPTYNPITEQFQKPSYSLPGTLLGAGGICYGAMVMRSSNKSQSRSASTTARSQPPTVQPSVTSSVPVEQVTPIYQPTQSINTDFTEDDFEIETVEEPVNDQKLIDQASNYIINREGCGILISSVTGTGKTTFLYSLLSRIHELCGNFLQLEVVDGKGSYWGGLENLKGKDGQPSVIITGDKEGDEEAVAAESVAQKIFYYEKLRARRSKQRIETERTGQPYNPTPLILLIEEWLMLKDVFDPKTKDKVLSCLNKLFSGGREDGIFVIVTTQSHLCKETEFSSGIRKNLMLIALGSNKKPSSVTDIIEDQWVIPSKWIRDEMKEKVKAMVNKQVPRFYFSSLQGDIDLMPTMDKDEERAKFERIFATNNVVQFRTKAQPIEDELTKDLWG